MVIYYPLFLDIEDRSCLVVGGGETALRKISRLKECGARIKLVSPTVLSEIKEILSNSQIFEREYQSSDVKNQLLVIIATNIEKLNRQIAQQAHQEGALVNVVDQPELCDFIMPALVKQKELQIAISTGGNSPALAAKMRKQLEGEYPAQKGEMLQIAGDIRELVKENIADQEIRKEIFHKIAELIANRRENENEA